MKRWLAVLSVVTILLGGAVWICRDDLKARYYTHKLLTTSDADLDTVVNEAGAWGDCVPGRLLDCLATEDAAACARAGAALARLRPAAFSAQLVERFGRLSAPGQQAALDCVGGWIVGQPADACTAYKQLIRSALQASDAGVRLHGAALAMRPEMGMAELLVPLLKDSSAEVRRAAILAVGPSRTLVADDDLLAWLHDPDAEVRRFSEAALLSRGLRPIDVRMGKLLTDPSPAIRLGLLVLLRDDGELDLSSWLQRLSEDTSPAVRAAAARLADDRQVFQLAVRLSEMAKSDPDLTVRQTAAYHAQRLKSSVRTVSGP